MTTPLLTLRDVTFGYGEQPVLHGIDLEIRAKEMVAVVGPNGAGKSTLLRLLLGLRHPDKGEAILNDRDLRSQSRVEIARKVAFVPQDTTLHADFLVEEIVAMGRWPHVPRFASPNQGDRSAVDSALQETGTAPLRHRSVLTLSGGERQRVFLARALAQNTPLLVLDEPNHSLDLGHAFHFLELVKKRSAGGVATIIALHDLELAARLCGRVILLHGGRILGDGPPLEVLTSTRLAEVFGIRAEWRHTERGPRLDVDGSLF
ncbi:MAG: ABC transporter ATP-binding protein [Myxococcales bacterium]|nr:ABC transporter ATP-binding protein [Myxococcales bacterium]